MAVSATNLLAGDVPATLLQKDSNNEVTLVPGWDTSDEHALESLLKNSSHHHRKASRRHHRHRDQHHHRPPLHADRIRKEKDYHEWASSDDSLLSSLLRKGDRSIDKMVSASSPGWASSDDSLLSGLLRKGENMNKSNKKSSGWESSDESLLRNLRQFKERNKQIHSKAKKKKHSQPQHHHRRRHNQNSISNNSSWDSGEAKEEEKAEETSSVQLSMLLQSTVDGDESTWYSDLDEQSKASSKSSIQLTLLLQSTWDGSSQECITFEYDEDYDDDENDKDDQEAEAPKGAEGHEESSESTLLWHESRSFASLSGVAILMNVPSSIEVPDGTVIDTSAFSSALAKLATSSESLKNSKSPHVSNNSTGDDQGSIASLHDTCSLNGEIGFYGGSGMSSCSSCSSKSYEELRQTLLKVERLALGTGWVDQDFFDMEGKSGLTLKTLMEEIETDSEQELEEDNPAKDETTSAEEVNDYKNDESRANLEGLLILQSDFEDEVPAKEEISMTQNDFSCSNDESSNHVNLEGLLILQPLAAEVPPLCSPPRYNEFDMNCKIHRLKAPQPHMDMMEPFIVPRKGLIQVYM